jgi:hypothetical protein
MKGDLLKVFIPIGDCCLTIKSRSPLTPLKKATVYTQVDSELVSIPKTGIQTVGVHEQG